jgi:hypothetical protein
MPGVAIDDVDQMMGKVFGEYVHNSDGAHLDCGIADDAAWRYWCRLRVYQVPM